MAAELTDEQIIKAWSHLSVWGFATREDRIQRGRELLALAPPAPSAPAARCAECGKADGDGWALYCVGCIETKVVPAMAPPAPSVQTAAQSDETKTLARGRLMLAKAKETAVERGAREAYDNRYHKVKADVGYDDWLMIWRKAIAWWSEPVATPPAPQADRQSDYSRGWMEALQALERDVDAGRGSFIRKTDRQSEGEAVGYVTNDDIPEHRRALTEAQEADARDAARYRLWRDALAENDAAFPNTMKAALPADVPAKRRASAAEWDAAIDAARAARQQEKP